MKQARGTGETPEATGQGGMSPVEPGSLQSQRRVSMGFPQARGATGSQKSRSSFLLITVTRIVIVLFTAWLSGMAAALRESLTRRRRIFLETRGTPQAPDGWGRDGAETNPGL